MNEKTKFQARQGDLLVEQIDHIPPGYYEAWVSYNSHVWPNGGKGEMVLALGEKTGHRHVIKNSKGVKLYLNGDHGYNSYGSLSAGNTRAILVLSEGRDLEQDGLAKGERGHKPTNIPAGTHSVTYQRQGGGGLRGDLPRMRQD